MVELKPCPFCGSEAEIMATESGVAVICKGLHVNGCGCRTEFYLDYQQFKGLDDWRKGKTAVNKTVEAWNRRVDNG